MNRLLAATLVLLSATGLSAAGPVDYLRDIKPLLKQRCYACHGALKQKGKLRLDTVAAMTVGGRNGPAVSPGDLPGSILLERVSDPDHRMPPIGKPLTETQIALLKGWIQHGAIAPKDEKPEADPKDHWAFQPPKRGQIPNTKHQIPANPVDAFLAAEWEKHGLTASPPADKPTLLRRVYLDLTGLPPTREDLEAFLADDSPGAYEKVVDRLLASPRYGERWARHWMDVWRYSDWYGRRSVPDVLNSYGQVWRWRDWIVRSLNADKPYDWMVRMMLAADELAPTDDANLVATGFLVRNFYRWNYNNWMRDDVEHTAKAFLGLTFNCCHCHDHKYDPITQEEYFKFRAFFEPLEIRHDRWPGEPDPGPYPKYKYGAAYKPITSGMVRVFDEKPDAKTFLYTGGDERNTDAKRGPIPPGAPKAFGGASLTIEPVTLPPEAWYPGLKSFVREEETKKRIDAATAAETALKSARAIVAKAESVIPLAGEDELAGLLPGLVAAAPAARRHHLAAARDAVALAEVRFATARSDLVSLKARIAADDIAYLGAKGDAKASARAASAAERQYKLDAARLAEAQARAALAAARRSGAAAQVKKLETQLNQATAAVETARKATRTPSLDYTPLSPKYTKVSSGRRSALAKWITSPDNPLTARVAANYLWGWHFGRPLVETTSNFGRSGKPPTNPELLDWLAAELVGPSKPTDGNPWTSPWSLKHLHRLIVTSQAYRMSSKGTEHARAADPDNVYLAYFPTQRMEAEVVRDAVLAAAGELDPTPFGPELPQEQGETNHRRSLWFAHHGEARMGFLELFDAANPCDAYRRTASVLPQQALALTNSELVQRQGRALARKLWAATGSEEAFVRAAFEQVLGRPPRDAERAASLGFLGRQVDLFAKSKLSAVPDGPSTDPATRAREDLVQALFNHTDFITIR
ncbi:MAG TPA: PSD1 and planctomycete cytochrome C domain-containing protein [Fimbriiglobus sp.]|nr:PSD1 and planctomycete cytochrome C domain-containing protein [Fimbriiglobus sp.]